MRLLIYLLALFSGFSAAEASRTEVSAASSVVQTSLAAAEVLASQEQSSLHIPVAEWPDTQAALVRKYVPFVSMALTPVLRNDITHQ